MSSGQVPKWSSYALLEEDTNKCGGQMANKTKNYKFHILLSKKLLNTLKRKEIFIYVTTWMNLESIMLSETN